MSSMMGSSHFTKQVYMSASSAITSIVYSLLQKPYLKARLRKELTWLFNSTERKPLHAGIAYRNLDNTSASNTIFRWWRERPWSRRSLRRYILCLHIFNTLPMWASKRMLRQVWQIETHRWERARRGGGSGRPSWCYSANSSVLSVERGTRCTRQVASNA